MRQFRRITSGIFARIDELCGQIENHEALADAALRGLTAGTAQAQARLARVRRDGKALCEELEKRRAAAAQWRERALRVQDDESKALECLRRSKRAAQGVAELEQRVADHDRAERELGKDVLALQERLGALREQRNLMRTRQARADAIASVHGGATGLSGELDSIFERWESRIAQTEFTAGSRPTDDDSLELELAGEEEQAALRAELEQLRGRHA
jgi:phage shock protein A